MKIAISDSCTLKFCGDLKKHWEEKHEVKYELGGSEFLAQWADLYYIDWIDNNIHYLFNWYKEHPDARKPKFIVRVIDWDFWVRGVRSQELVDFVDYWICIAPHIQAGLLKEKDDSTGRPINWGDKLHLIYPGVDLNKFTLKTAKTDGFQLGMVLGDMWWYKNHMGGLDIFKTLADSDERWRLHIRGQHEPGQYNPVMFNHYLESRGIKEKVMIYEPQEDMNMWYEKIDYLLHPGMKEAFCYAVAEAMAKGITPIINNFYGADLIWPNEYLYNTHNEAINKITLFQYPKTVESLSMEEELIIDSPRYFIEQHYSNEKMFAAFDHLCGT